MYLCYLMFFLMTNLMKSILCMNSIYMMHIICLYITLYIKYIVFLAYRNTYVTWKNNLLINNLYYSELCIQNEGV